MKNQQYEFYKVPQVKDLKELIAMAAESYGDKPAFSYEEDRKEKSATFTQLKGDIEALGTYIYSLGLRNEKIALYGENSYEWIVTYFAAVCGSQVIVPIDKELGADEVVNLLNDSGAKMVVYGKTKKEAVEEIKSLSPESVDKYICIDEFSQIIKDGNDLLACGNNEFITNEIDREALCSIIYTSGTTGKPKGVMLNQRNLAYDTVASSSNILIPSDTTLLLPLNHTFGFTACVLCMILRGYSVYINTKLRNILPDIKKSKPGHISLVPLFVEKFYKSIWKNAEKQGKDKILKKLIAVSNKMRKVGIDMRPVFFKSIREAFGGRIEMLISGGAPIDKKYINGFDDFGIQIINGYGITECSPIVSTNRNHYSRFGSVGTAIPGTQVKIINQTSDGEGEICVKGDGVMMGYYNNPEATADVLSDGWFKTGDIGKIDDDGFIFITGRKKNIIVLSNGKNVYPEEIEEEILKVENVAEVVVYGDNDILVAEIYTEEKEAQDVIKENVQALNKILPSYKQIKHIKFRDTEFEKTTTKKIKRTIKM